MIDWNNLFKVRLSNIVDESMDKHDIVKLLIVRKILRKYRKRTFLRVYTEHKINNGSNLRPDVFFEDTHQKIIICYEIQKILNEDYIKRKTNEYKRYEEKDIYIKSVDVIFVPLKSAPDNLLELNKWLDEYVV